jgi:hypothetical protein
MIANEQAIARRYIGLDFKTVLAKHTKAVLVVFVISKIAVTAQIGSKYAENNGQVKSSLRRNCNLLIKAIF